MKTNKPHNFLLLALTAVFSCCSGEDYSDITVSGTLSGETSTAPLTITVTDGGYASLSGGPSTRASEVDYQTVFTEGDQIGVFAVKDNAIVKEVSNLCLTAHAVTSATDAGNASPSTDASAALTWLDGQSNAPNIQAGATYYAYYPYKSDLEIADLAPAAPNATGFFASVITNWTPAKHQSTYADYTAQDLMIAQGAADISNKSLSFSMSHQMALVVIDLPNKTYSLSNDPTYTWKVDTPDTKFNDFTPYRMDNGMYRYLVHPSTDDALLSGSYTGEHGTTAWKVNTKSIPAGNYKIYKVDGGSTQLTHTLASGDFYMKDGSLIAGNTQSLTPAQQAACIGIVFWVGDATKKDKTLKSDHPDCTHGLVVASKDAVEGTSVWQNPYISVQSWLNSYQSREYLSVASGRDSNDPLNNIQGYNNTKTIEEFNDGNAGNLVQAVSTVVNYRKNVLAPKTSSDWYLPSAKELTLLCGKDVDDIWSNCGDIGTANKDLINNKIGLIGKVATGISSADYWSSTELSYDSAFRVTFGNGIVYYSSKSHTYRVRGVLAF